MTTDWAEYSVSLPTAAGTRQVSIRVPRAPLRMCELVPLAQRFTDATVDAAIEQEQREGRAISCRAGCGACCRQLVPVSPPEAFHLANHLLSLEEAQRDAFLARFDSVESALDALGMMPRLQALMNGQIAPKDFGSIAADYFALGLACPALVDESCGVHPDRPLSCRDFNVTSPAEWCKTPAQFRIRKVPTAPLLSEPLARVAARLTGTRVELIPLSLAMRWVDDHAELGMREWPGTNLFEAFLAELGTGAAA